MQLSPIQFSAQSQIGLPSTSTLQLPPFWHFAIPSGKQTPMMKIISSIYLVLLLLENYFENNIVFQYLLKNLLSSQLVPVYPGLQVQVYPASLSSFLHVPPFKHGLLGKHASSSITPKPSKLFQDMLLLVLWWNCFNVME